MKGEGAWRVCERCTLKEGQKKRTQKLYPEPMALDMPGRNPPMDIDMPGMPIAASNTKENEKEEKEMKNNMESARRVHPL